MERPEEVTRFLRCGGMNCDCLCEKGGKVEGCLTWRVHGYVEELEARIPRWISVKERMPEHMDDVLVWVGGLVEVGCYDEINECWELYTYVGDGSVTHWMPLPEPPKEDSHV